MKKIILSALVVAMTISCKKTEELSVQDPASGVVAPAMPITNEPAPDTVMMSAPPMPEAAAPVAPADGKAPVMTFEKTEHDFGTITQGDKPSYSFTFKNTGASDLVISNAVGSCGCTVPDYPKQPVKPGESGKIKVSFNSSGKNGRQQKTVTITTNTAAGKELLTIRTNINPKA